MRCQWQQLLSVLPLWLREDIQRESKDSILEIRLRLHAPPELVMGTKRKWLQRNVTREDLQTCINSASRYSPWAAATISQCYLTVQGGHRMGICGDAIVKDGRITGIREVTSIHIRVARDISGLSAGIDCGDNLLIIGAPGWGKTSLLRDLVRRISDAGGHVAVVDERGEIFPSNAFPSGKCTDILTGCRKQEGIQAVLRTMGPDWIAVDEITEEKDCEALLEAGWCGVRLIATAHAASMRDLRSRRIYRALLSSGIFSRVVILKPDKTWTQERMEQCNTNGSARY